MIVRRLILLVCIGFAFTVHAGNRDPNWCGSPFSLGSSSLPMPAGWPTLPVSYPAKLADADLVVSFGQQTYPALKEVVAEYAKAQHMKIVVQSGTCGISAGKLLRKKVDSGAFCCPPGKNDRLPGLEFHTIAISPIAIIVNRQNPLDDISTANAREVFKGRIANWSELTDGGWAHDILTVGRLHCKGRPGHWTLLLKSQEQFSPRLTEVGVIPDLIVKVGQEPYAVSLETPFMMHKYDRDRQVKALKIDGHAVSDTDYVAAGHYPFYRTYNLTTWSNGGDKREKTLALIHYLRNYIEQHYADYGFVPISRLRAAGWKFQGDELVAEPDSEQLAKLPPL
jgi:ABC-type phosphate transport system substrate-binding protein